MWSASDADSGIVETGLTGDGQGVIVVSGRGRVDIRDFATGALRSSMRRTVKLANDSERVWAVAIHAAPDLVAITYNGAVTIADAGARRVVGHIGGPDATSVEYAGGRLLVQRETGPLEVWDLHGPHGSGSCRATRRMSGARSAIVRERWSRADARTD